MIRQFFRSKTFKRALSMLSVVAVMACVGCLFSFAAEGDAATVVSGVQSVTDAVTSEFDIATLVDLVVPWEVIKLGIPILIAIINMDKIYDAIMWILRKIPMLGMS